jgi:transposase
LRCALVSSFIVRKAAEVPEHLDVHLVLDNYAMHKHPPVRRWFASHPRFILHFTPTSASWLNQVERFFAEITRRRIRRGTFTGVAALERAINEYIANHNELSARFVWTATADTIFGQIIDN